MTEFKKGDRVRVITNEGWKDLPLGRTGTIHEIPSFGDTVAVRWDDPDTEPQWMHIFPRRLEIIPTSLTDEELAAKYRALRQECNQGWKELKARGYSVGGRTEGGITIYKYVEEEVPVIKIEKVKKEL